MNPEAEGEDLFGEMQSTPLQRNNPVVNPVVNQEQEQDTLAVSNQEATATTAGVWTPKSPKMGGSFRLEKMSICHILVVNLTLYGLD